MNAFPFLFLSFLVSTITMTFLPRTFASLPEMSQTEMHVPVQGTACSEAFTLLQCVGLAMLGQKEHLPRIQISQLCLLSLPRHSVQTGSEKYMSIWPEFLDVQQSRTSNISSQKMRQDQQNPDT